MRTIKLIKNRSDIGAGTRGSDLGVDAIEIAAINQNEEYFSLFDFEDIETENETVYNKVKNSFAKRIGSVLTVCTRLSNSVEQNLKSNVFLTLKTLTAANGQVNDEITCCSASRLCPRRPFPSE